MIRTQAQGRCGAAELCATCRIATTAFVELANLVDQHLSGVEPDQWAIIIRWTPTNEAPPQTDEVYRLARVV